VADDEQPAGAPGPSGDGSASADEQQAEGESRDLSDLVGFGCDDTGCRVDDMEDSTAGTSRLMEDPSSEFVSTEPAELRRFLARPGSFVYNIAEVTAAGRVRSVRVGRNELLASTGLRARDLRAVAVQPQSGADAGPVLAGRRKTLLLGLGGVRAIVEPERALLFGPSTRDQARFLRVLENQRRTASDASFGMLFVESALLALNRKLGSRLVEIRGVTEPKLRNPPAFLEPDLEEVRQQRRMLVRCASQASAVTSALLSRLDDGDLVPVAAGGEADQDAVDEWETMLEVYLLAYSEISRECTSLLSDIEDFEGSVSLTLQSRRLRVEQFELSLVIASLSISVGSLLPGIFGMNLVSGQETKENIFGAAVLVTLSCSGSLFVGLRWLASTRGFLS